MLGALLGLFGGSADVIAAPPGIDHPPEGDAGSATSLVLLVLAVVSAVLIARFRWYRLPRDLGRGALPPELALGLVALMLLLAAWPRLVAPMMRPDATEESRDILFVMVDTWRADHTGFLGYERDTCP